MNLAYRYENPQYAAAVIFERTAPRLSARTFSFLQISPEGLNAHYEVIYNIEEARTQNLSLLLPENTPTALSIRGLDGVVVKELSLPRRCPGDCGMSKQDENCGEYRRWNVLLAEVEARQSPAWRSIFSNPCPAKSRKTTPCRSSPPMA